MNSQIPPTDPLDEQERKLARIVRALPGGEPPPALDVRILKAAGNAAAASRRPRARWLASAGALWGIGGTAAAVLALGVSWQMMYAARPSTPSESAPAAAMAGQAQDSGVPAEIKARPAREHDDASPPAPPAAQAAPAPRTRARIAAPSAPPPPATMPEPFAGAQLEEHVAARDEADASAEAMAPSQARVASTGETAVAAKAESLANAAQAAPAAPQATAVAPATGALGYTQAPPPMQPARWLAHIRQLRDDKRAAEAKASLQEFHTRYPDFTIPSDLAPLLRE